MSMTPALFIILCSGEHEKIQMAAMTASVAAVSDRPVEVFVSMNALALFRKDFDKKCYEGGDFSNLMQERKVPDAIELFQQRAAAANADVIPGTISIPIPAASSASISSSRRP